ncbi:hypothetical protein [Mucilaginibacter lacusdianchii]|uniref:hypothetical protein n=1 Tax=Mucilaginibacter lacusdianchii TaxID=2684211 RepID=UPI00131C7BC5|nr:hypothetical protein [Mucilaginibacter sp. JXJ CY 39]
MNNFQSDDFDAAIDITIKGVTYSFNTVYISDFLTNCEAFMSIDGNDFEVMTQNIADAVIDNATTEASINELRPQLKFLREIGFLLKGFTKVSDEE